MRLKRIARVAAKSFFACADPFFGKLSGPRILIYHQVGTNLGREMEIPTETFRRQLDWLQVHGEIVDLETAIARRDEPGAEKRFVLTFDDGYEDVYGNAYPLLKERGLPITLYLTTRPIETGEPLDPRFPEARPFTWDQVTEMTGTGLVTVGAHTHTHLDFRVATPDQMAEELDTSNRLIEERTGVRPRHFTYPFGWWSATADPLVRERYATATVGSTSPITADSDLATLGRLPIQSSDGVAWFTRRVVAGLRLENTTRRRLAGYSGP